MIRKAPELESADAQCSLGMMYADGRGVPQDGAEMVKRCRKAGFLGNQMESIVCGVGFMVQCGCQWHIKKEELLKMQIEDNDKHEHSVAAYREAAEQGDAFAQYKLGCCYYHGDGVGCDYQEAVRWFRKAAEQGNAAAQNSLGDCYCFGRGVEKDYTEAMMWYRKAAEQGYASALALVNFWTMLNADETIKVELLSIGVRACGCVSSFLPFSIIGEACSLVDRFFPKHKQMVKQDVVASTFSPSQVRRNSNLLVSVFLHTREEVALIKRFAREIQKNAERRSYKPLSCQLKDGDRVDVSLNVFAGNKLLSSQVKNITWQGEGVHDSCTFRYFITGDFPMDEICCEVNVSMNNVPIGEMLFNVKIGEDEDATPAEFGSREYKKIFISYSHEDGAKVKYIANAYKLEGKNYFFDRHCLKSGDDYPEEIRNFINTADLFILCWSANASKSEYVRKELSQALNLAYPKIQPRERARLTIRPLSIDPRADPPDEMKDIYNFEEV